MMFFFASRFYKIAIDSSHFRKKMLYLQMKELFDRIATQNAEIRTVAKSLPLFLKQFAKSLFINWLSQADKKLK